MTPRLLKRHWQPTGLGAWLVDGVHDTTLAAVSSAKYLGVCINNKLSWNTHVDVTVKKATQSLNFIRRNFACCPAPIREQCYKTLVRPQLEYASSVWDNPVKCNVTKIEPVQTIMQHGSPVETSNIHRASQPCCRNSSGIISNTPSMKYSPNAIASGMTWLPFPPQLTFNQLPFSPEDPKPEADPVQNQHIQSYLLSKRSLPVEHTSCWCLPAAAGQLRLDYTPS